MKLTLNNYAVEVVKPKHRLLVGAGVPRNIKSLYQLRKSDVQKLGYYSWSDLPEELCQKMCTKKDNGSQYSPSSRYEYSTAVSSGHKSGDYTISIWNSEGGSPEKHY